MSLAVPQSVSNKDTKATREEEPGSTAKQGPPPYEVKIESPSAYMVKQGRKDALDTVRRAVASLRNPVVSDSNPLGLPLDSNSQAPTLRLVTL